MRPECKEWYQFVKHSIRLTVYDETIDKTRMVLLYCITSFSEVCVAKIIVQEIQACSKKKKGTIHFPCLIYALYKRQDMP